MAARVLRKPFQMVWIAGRATAGGSAGSCAVDAEAGGVLSCELAVRVVLGCEFDVAMGTPAVRVRVLDSQVGKLDSALAEGKIMIFREFAAGLVAICALPYTLLYEAVVVTLEFSVQQNLDDGCTFSFEQIALGGEEPIELRIVREFARFEEA